MLLRTFNHLLVNHFMVNSFNIHVFMNTQNDHNTDWSCVVNGQATD